jgi:sulfopyruvate decarboxylase subunit beta
VAHSEKVIDRMSVRACLQALADARDDRTVIVTNQGAARVWPLLASHPLDFHYNPSTMGGAVPLGLGLAMGQPAMQVVVVSGDGALLMSLGSLVSVVAAGVQNITVVVLDNGLYEVTGGQRTPGYTAAVDYAGLAKSLGFVTALTFSEAAEWRANAGAALHAPGPRFITLRVAAARSEDMLTPAPPMAEQLAQLSRHLKT